MCRQGALRNIIQSHQDLFRSGEVYPGTPLDGVSQKKKHEKDDVSGGSPVNLGNLQIWATTTFDHASNEQCSKASDDSCLLPFSSAKVSAMFSRLRFWFPRWHVRLCASYRDFVYAQAFPRSFREWTENTCFRGTFRGTSATEFQLPRRYCSWRLWLI